MLTFDRFIQIGFWLVVFPFILLFSCFAFGLTELPTFLFPYLTLLGWVFQLLGDRDTPETAAPIILSVILLQSIVYGSIVILSRKKARTIVLLSAVHVAVYLTTVFLYWRYVRPYLMKNILIGVNGTTEIGWN